MVKIVRPAAASPPKKVKQSPQTTINKGPAQASPPKPDFDKVCQIFGSLRAATKERRLLEKEVAELEVQIAFKREQLRLARDDVIAMPQAFFPDLCDMSDDAIKAVMRLYSPSPNPLGPESTRAYSGCIAAM